MITDLNLKTYLTAKNMTFIEFGKLVDLNPRYLGMLSKGKFIPSRRTAKIIEEATGGEVKLKYKERKIEPPRVRKSESAAKEMVCPSCRKLWNDTIHKADDGGNKAECENYPSYL